MVCATPLTIQLLKGRITTLALNMLSLVSKPLGTMMMGDAAREDGLGAPAVF